ncbi:hypothetical protein BJ684DRAFT_19331 [Piptocephalis cylindrospora]|uniref:t-SNARE coiled-coil homology domain-containing protein n=1 Tax=Piptocephalis cylindrospora TaxID=1907219 RepID=A0A4P9Y5E6_9FUNG|nr:hypothetical protein BJ684DRAFT_19331 [Piptocephalis cylindrospora]|eukprot:RKP14238.1 hypothetical protein BJ684DRAFT_19331 [Piptocephalis cylindrospora]
MSSSWDADKARTALFSGALPQRDSPSQNRVNTEQQQALLEQQNDLRMEEMSSRAGALHRITVDVHDEVNRQNSFLGESGTAFTAFGGRLQSTGQRLRTMARSRHNQRTFRWTAVVILVFLFFFYGHRWFFQGKEVDVPLDSDFS